MSLAASAAGLPAPAPPAARGSGWLRRAAACGLLALTVWPARASDPIFDAARLHETRLVMDPADWQALRDNFRTNQYYAANVSFDGELFEQVGVRSRGKGSRDPNKPGLRLDFNRYGRDREFHGMKSLVLDNEVQDASLLREVLAYGVFEAMGLPAPQVAYTRVTVNGDYWGVYAQTEDVRKAFLKARFGSDDDGNLFAYEWAGAWDLSWRGEDPALYVPEPFEPQTNEDDLDASALVALIRTVNEAPDETLLRDVSAFIDVERFLSYVATENALAESDGFLGDQGMNNFYLYQSESGTRFTLIPWDKDTAFRSPDWPVFRAVDSNVLVRRLLQFEEPRRFYAAEVERAVSQFVNGRWLLPRLEANYALIREAVLSDTKKPQANDEFELSVEGLRGIIDSRADSLSSQLGPRPARR